MKKVIICSIGLFVVMLFDLGNPDALRQGTEGFYLKVASEMFQKNSFLTPYYLDNPHWSKPPFLFLLPQLFYFLTDHAGLFVSRLAVLIFSIALTALAALKIEKLTGTKAYLFLLFCFSTVGFFKYSRIFMMEMPLMLLSFLSAIYFYSFLESSKKSDFWYAVLLGVLSCQVKGPVSIAMLVPSFGLYSIYHFLVFKRLYFKAITLWTISTIILSSFWFIYEYVIFGSKFIDYFFLRENAGKFSSKSYPITHVIQGLLLYALPWSFLAPKLIWNYYKNGVVKLSNTNTKFIVFLVSCFIVFFCLWLVPSQRSHHYAIPSIPFFLFIIYLEFFKDKAISKSIDLFFKIYISFFSLIGVLIVSLTFIFKESFQQTNSGVLILGILLLIAIIASLFRKSQGSEKYFVSHLVLVTIFWSFFIPNYILPLVPNKIMSSTAKIKNIGAVHRKPYFIAESLEREVKVLGIDGVAKFLTNDDSAVIIDGPLFLLLDKNRNYKILQEWPVWRRGLKFNEIIKYLRLGSIEKLRSKVYLISF